MLHCIEKLNEVRRDLGALERTVKQIGEDLQLISQRSDNKPLEIPPSIDQWMSERLVTFEQDGSRIAAGVAYDDYSKWAKARAIVPETLSMWGRAMTKMFSKKPINGHVVYFGFRLR